MLWEGDVSSARAFPTGQGLKTAGAVGEVSGRCIMFQARWPRFDGGGGPFLSRPSAAVAGTPL